MNKTEKPDMVQMPTGAVRSCFYSGGNGRPEANRLDLLLKNREALETYAEAYARGMRKYGRDNWLKGFPESVLIQHAMDHLIHYVNGTYDPGEKDVDQLSGVLWNIGTLCWLRKQNHPELMDITGPDPGPEEKQSWGEQVADAINNLTYDPSYPVTEVAVSDELLDAVRKVEIRFPGIAQLLNQIDRKEAILDRDGIVRRC